MTHLTPVTFNLYTHELTRLSAVLTACTADLDLLTLHANECDAHKRLYSNLNPEQRCIHQQLTEAGILNDLGSGS